MEPEVLRVADVTLHRGSRKVSVESRPVDLTPSEFDLLAAFRSSPGRAFTRRRAAGSAARRRLRRL